MNAHMSSPMIAMLVVVYAFALIACIAYYVFYAVGLYTLAKRKAVPHAWMAWLPVLNSITLGRVSQMPDKKRHAHIVLPILEGVVYALLILLLVFAGFMAFSATRIGHGGFRGSMNFQGNMMSSQYMMSSALGFALVYLLVFAVSIAYCVVFYMALHRVYKQFAPEYSTFFTVMSIVFGLYPFFLFAMRNKPFYPNGVPAYAAPYVPPYPAEETPALNPSVTASLESGKPDGEN